MTATIYRRDVADAARTVARQHRQKASAAYREGQAVEDTMHRTMMFSEHSANLDIARAFEAFADQIDGDANDAN